MIRSSELRHSFMLMKWIWTQQMFLCLMVSSTSSLVTVYQPPVVASALGQAVMLHCQLNLTLDEKLLTSPVLYWDNMNTKDRLWPQTVDKYINRVQLMDKNANSLNKSILLTSVQWHDSGKYLCKLSINTEKEKCRKLGGGTSLMVYDTMTFKLTSRNDTTTDLLHCKIKVTRDPALVLSVVHNGAKLKSVHQDAAAAQPSVTLSMSEPVRGRGKYECQLHLNTALITKSSFLHNPLVAEEERDADKNVTGTSSPTVAGAVVFPEPWFLYGSLLLVTITILLGIITIWKGKC
ncbi:uncharacterized protein LOC141801227 [Halichoeres trimaculatus]|uniref:uncharacterized protein LOC141801227 n=1 Tax=Halichoeres trimaculatus TaxID=147232 RepID=UPI003D9E5FE8